MRTDIGRGETPPNTEPDLDLCRICWTTLDGAVRKSDPMPRDLAFFRAREESYGRLRLACWVEPFIPGEEGELEE